MGNRDALWETEMLCGRQRCSVGDRDALCVEERDALCVEERDALCVEEEFRQIQVNPVFLGLPLDAYRRVSMTGIILSPDG